MQISYKNTNKIPTFSYFKDRKIPTFSYCGTKIPTFLTSPTTFNPASANRDTEYHKCQVLILTVELDVQQVCFYVNTLAAHLPLWY